MPPVLARTRGRRARAKSRRESRRQRSGGGQRHGKCAEQHDGAADLNHPVDEMGFDETHDSSPKGALRHLVRHPPARIGAAPAHLGARRHARVIGHPFAVSRAPFAHFGARGAGVVMQVRPAQHEVRAGLADLGAVHHQSDVIRLRVMPALLEAIRNRLQARLVAVAADLDALEHLFIEVMALRVGHMKLRLTLCRQAACRADFGVGK